MKNTILILLCITGLQAFAQDSTRVTFALDTIRVDSFFLIETVTFKIEGQERPKVVATPFYFSDTTAFNQYILALSSRTAALERQKEQLDVEYSLTIKHLAELEALRDSVFRGATEAFIKTTGGEVPADKPVKPRKPLQVKEGTIKKTKLPITKKGNQ